MRNMERKQQLRKAALFERDAIPEEVRRQKSTEICKRLLQMPFYSESGQILVYSAVRSEADLTFFCRQAWADGKILYFPKVFGERMEFVRVNGPEEFCPGAFSVMEPDTDNMNTECFRDRDACSVILVPGAAFSRDGFRIGYGGGYYDKYLAVYNHLHGVGICFEEQLSDRLEPEEHDVCMKEIVTEQQTIHIP